MGSPTEKPAATNGNPPNPGGVDKSTATFWDHLEVLRGKLITVLIISVGTTVVVFVLGDYFLQLLLRHPRELGIELVYLKPQEKFISYLRTAFYLGILIGIPVLIIELLSFVVPALDRKETMVVVPATSIVVLLYFLGTLFAYFFLLPYALGFFVEFGTGEIRAVWSIGAYIQLFGSIVMVCGLLFLLPVMLWVSVKIGIVDEQQLKKARKFVILGLFVTAALFTPPDPFTQIVVALILYGLYELTILMVRFSEVLKRGKHE